MKRSQRSSPDEEGSYSDQQYLGDQENLKKFEKVNPLWEIREKMDIEDVVVDYWDIWCISILDQSTIQFQYVEYQQHDTNQIC